MGDLGEAAFADGIATALFFTDGDRLDALGGFDWLRMYADRIEHSPGFGGELFD